MTTIYLVTHGEYSDYSVDFAFETRELAEAFCERENVASGRSSYDAYRVEEMTVLDALPEAWLPRHAAATLTPEGVVYGVRFWSSGRFFGAHDPEAHHVDRLGDVQLVVNYHRSEDEARKALYDLAARVKAERAGVA